MTKGVSIVGDLINFRGMVYSPVNENGVVFLFGRVVDDLHMYIEEIKPGYPDCVARRYTGKGWERILVEFEYQSSNFKAHKHDPSECDIIVCWENDWKEAPLEVIELKTEILAMKNMPIKHPTTSTEPTLEGKEALESLFKTHKVPSTVQAWYHQIEDCLHEWNEEIWTNVGRKYIGIYSPEKAFVLLEARPTCLRIECFSRGEPIKGTSVLSQKFSPKWVKFSVKQANQVDSAIEILKISHGKLKAALQAGEPTAYFSGGIQHGSSKADDEVENDVN